MSAWTPENEPVRTAGGAVTLVEGSSFCVSTEAGDLPGAGAYGVFFRDTRILSRWELRIDGEQPDPLAAMTPDPYRATFLARLRRRPGWTDSHLLVERERRVGDGLREDIVIRNPGAVPSACTVEVTVGADFADLFDVKEGRARRRGQQRTRAEVERLVIDQRWRAGQRAVVVEAPGSSSAATVRDDESSGVIRYDVVVPGRGQWSASLLVRPVVDGEDVAASFPLDRPVGESLPAQRLRRWHEGTPVVTSGHEGLQSVLRRSREDLGALRIFDREDPSLASVAAGAPWFMALFGRDSLLTAYMAVAMDHGLGIGTLRTLARHQGRRVRPVTEEEPGRILHEVRAGQSLGGDGVYYGTADASPLFVVLLGEVARWGADPADIRDLLPHADRALDWVERFGDRDGDGFVEYQRATDRGLSNQGWKDSWDGITYADGRLPDAPIALCEVQGYVYDAYRTRAVLAEQLGDDDTATRWFARAALLKSAFNEQFWLPERGWYALALDRDKRPVDACASNMGHCLWSGIVDDDKAPLVAQHLLSPEMFSGWGVRTLSTAMGAYDPVSYHNGSVWPHDNALVVAGLVRYGFIEEARRIAEALLEAAQVFGGRLPELFCGFDRGRYPEPVPYPTSCSPQAWAAAAPVQLVRSLLRFDPSYAEGRVWLSPVLPTDFLPLRMEGISLGPGRLTLDVSGDGTRLEGLPASFELRTDPWPAHEAG